MPETASRKAKVAIFISGSGTNMAALVYASRLPGSHYEVVLVASNKPDAAGLAFAAAEGIETFTLSNKGMERADHDAAMEHAVSDSGAELIALAGYMRILSPEFTARWAGRLVNIHPSLLPKYRGLETHKRAIEAGESAGGASVHLVSEELDAGEVLGHAKVAIASGDTPETLAERVKLAEHQLYPSVLNEYAGRPYDPVWLLDRVRALALALPETEARDSHGSPGFRAGGKSGKIFALFNDQHHGVDAIAVLVKTSGQEELMDLIERDPDTFYKPAYYGASGWVGIILNRPGVDWSQVEYWLSRSWRSVAPKRLTAVFEAADEF